MHTPNVGRAPDRALRQVAHRHARPRGVRGFLAAADRGARWRHRCARDVDQPDPPRLVPHRLDRRPHDRVSRLAARRLRLVRVDVVPRPAPPVGPARVRAAPASRLARPRSTRPAIPASPGADCPRARGQAHAPWLALLRGHVGQFRRRTGHVPTASPDRRQHPRDQRDDPHRERADRRGVRSRPRRQVAAPGVGRRTPTCSSRPITARCRATSGATSSRARSTPTR